MARMLSRVLAACGMSRPSPRGATQCAAHPVVRTAPMATTREAPKSCAALTAAKAATSAAVTAPASAQGMAQARMRSWGSSQQRAPLRNASQTASRATMLCSAMSQTSLWMAEVGEPLEKLSDFMDLSALAKVATCNTFLGGGGVSESHAMSSRMNKGTSNQRATKIPTKFNPQAYKQDATTMSCRTRAPPDPHRKPSQVTPPTRTTSNSGVIASITNVCTVATSRAS
mmetsp:Transcript_96811/g.273583  ORF Transcript_96811/g.273583 Transcript_96811/m.273583 type:complete len:228 (+) Transcript_96811:768-1451(+)